MTWKYNICSFSDLNVDQSIPFRDEKTPDDVQTLFRVYDSSYKPHVLLARP